MLPKRSDETETYKDGELCKKMYNAQNLQQTNHKLATGEALIRLPGA